MKPWIALALLACAAAVQAEEHSEKQTRADIERHRAMAAAHEAAAKCLEAGKGHEAYQEIQGIRHPFSDVDQTRAALETWNEAQGELS